MSNDYFYKTASYNSFWRGYHYYENGNVLSWNKVSEFEYEGIVKSDNGKDEYKVVINLKKPRSSKCSCLFAEGRYVVCKHMVALYFAIFPEEFDAFNRRVEKEREEYEKALEQRIQNLEKRKKN